MNKEELSNIQTTEEIGAETVNEFVQNIPGTAPSFDTITEEELTENRIVPKIKKPTPDPDAYKATSTTNNANNN